MSFLVGLLTLSVLALIAIGFYFEWRPAREANARRWFAGTLAGNLALFVGGLLGLFVLGSESVMAAEAVNEAMSSGGVSVGLGLALIGAGLPTVGSTIAAGIAVGPIGAASLAALSEKPELLGRTLIYLGLAEGIAIYGLVMSILLLQKI